MGMKLPPDIMAKINAMIENGEAHVQGNMTWLKPRPVDDSPLPPPSSHGIIIYDWHPTLDNRLVGQHWSKVKRMKDADKEIIATYARPFPRARRKRRIHLRIVLAPRQRGGDPTNYWKSLLDALVACGQLVDDSGRWCEAMPPRIERGERKRTEIILEDMEG